MNCRKARANLSRYVDRRLDPDTRRSLDQHLSQCSGCAAELDGLREVENLLRREACPPPPPSLASNIVLRARAEHSRALSAPAWIRVWRAWSAGMRLAAAASAALAVIAGLLVGGAGDARPRGETAWLQASSGGAVLAAYQGAPR